MLVINFDRAGSRKGQEYDAVFALRRRWMRGGYRESKNGDEKKKTDVNYQGCGEGKRGVVVRVCNGWRRERVGKELKVDRGARRPIS